MKDFSPTLMRSEIGWNSKGPQQVYRLLFQVRPDLFLYIEAGELTVYAGSLEHIGELRDSLLGYVITEVEDSPKFMLIDVHSGGAYATPVQLHDAAEVSHGLFS